MASKLQPATPRPKHYSRTASMELGGKAPLIPKSLNGEGTHKLVHERKTYRPAPMERRMPAGRVAEGQDDHIKVKEQLAMIERSKSSLMHDLARAKRNVDELTMKLNGVNGGACKKDKVHTLEMDGAAVLEREGWQVELDAMKQQYEQALLELQTSKQAMESLKHELMVCVEAKDEAVRLAGEAMSAAESTARRVEELSAELSSTKGSGPVVGMDDLIDELPGAMETSLLEMSPETIGQKETLLPGIEESKGRCRTDSIAKANFEIQRGESVQGNDMQVDEGCALTFTLEALHKELAAARDAEKKAINEYTLVQTELEREKLEAEKSRSAESVAKASLAKVCRELEEAQEKLDKASVEGAALVVSLESCKAELEKSREEAKEALDREMTARNKATELVECIEKMKESYQAELLMCKQGEASACAMIESLRVDLERQKSESNMAAEKELMAAAKISDMIKELERSRTELIEQQKHSSSEIVALSTKLEANQARLLSFEEMESFTATRIAALRSDIDKKQAEVDNLQHRLSEVESSNAIRIAAFISEMDKKQAEVDGLQCRLSEMQSKAEAAMAELSHLSEISLELAELKVKEQEANAKMAALDAEVLGLKQALEEALDASEAARGRLQNLEAALQNSISERDEAKCEALTAQHQIELSKQLAEDLMVQVKAAKEDAERAIDAERSANNAAMTEVLRACQLAKEEAQMVREEVCVAENKLRSALEDAERASTELEKLKKEAQTAREDADLQKAALTVEKERANAMEDEAKEVLGEVLKLRAELTKLQADAMGAMVAREAAEQGLQTAMEQLEAHNLRRKEEELAHHMSEDEVASLKEKLRLCEEQLRVVTSEAESLESSKMELLMGLEAAEAEKEVSKRALLDAHQHVTDMEKAKRVMEADIQRLLDDSKLWRTPKDSRDIMALSEVNGLNGNVLMADSRDEKPQPDSPERDSVQSFNATTYLHMNGGEKRGEEVVAEKEDDNEAHAEDVPVRTGKKKRHALLHRLHSYLDKKKTSS